jgi:hypothetical protein
VTWDGAPLVLGPLVYPVALGELIDKGPIFSDGSSFVTICLVTRLLDVNSFLGEKHSWTTAC